MLLLGKMEVCIMENNKNSFSDQHSEKNNDSKIFTSEKERLKAIVLISLVFIFPVMLPITILSLNTNVSEIIKEPNVLFKVIGINAIVTSLYIILPLAYSYIQKFFEKIYKENTELIQAWLKFNSIILEKLMQTIIIGGIVLITIWGIIIAPLCQKFNWGTDNPKSIFRKPNLMYQGYVYAFPCPDFECTSKNYKVVADIQYGDVQKIYFRNGGYLEMENCDGNGLGGDDYFCEEVKTGKMWVFEYYGELVKKNAKNK